MMSVESHSQDGAVGQDDENTAREKDITDIMSDGVC